VTDSQAKVEAVRRKWVERYMPELDLGRIKHRYVSVQGTGAFEINRMEVELRYLGVKTAEDMERLVGEGKIKILNRIPTVHEYAYLVEPSVNIIVVERPFGEDFISFLKRYRGDISKWRVVYLYPSTLMRIPQWGEEGKDYIVVPYKGFVDTPETTESFALYFVELSPRKFYATDFIKTQAFTDEEVEPCARVHMLISDFLEDVEREGLAKVHVKDEGNFYKTGDVNKLLESFGATAALIGKLTRMLTGKSSSPRHSSNESEHHSPEKRYNPVLAGFTIEGGTLKALVSAYSAVQDEFCWLFTRRRMEARALDLHHVALIELQVFPMDYESEVDRLWVFGSVEQLKKVAKRFKKRDRVRVEVREDKNLYVGPFKVGSEIKEDEVFEDFKPSPVTIRRDAILRVVTADFRRIVKQAAEEKVRDYWTQDAYENIGIKIEGREATILFFNKKVSRMDLKGYEPWVLNIEGEGMSTYSLQLFASLLIWGLTETVDISFQNEGVLQLTYTGNDFSVNYWLAPKIDPDTGKILPRFLEALAKPPAVRKQLWILREEEVKLLEKTVRAIGDVCRAEKLNIGMTAEGLWLYWKEYDKGYFRAPHTRFWEWLPPPTERMSGVFKISSLTTWLKDVEELACFLEGEPPEAIVLVGKGTKIAPKELRSQELVKELEVPEVRGMEVFTGQTSMLRDVFEDAMVAEEAFLVLFSTPFEIVAFGRDTVYYRASLPLDAFQTIEEDYVPVNNWYFKGLRDFFGHFPAPLCTMGRLESNIFLTGENPLGSFKAVIMQTAEQAEEAVKAYNEMLKKPSIPTGVKPLPPPIPTPPPKPPFISKEEFIKIVRENLERLIKQVYPQLTVEEVFTSERQREADELYEKLERIKPSEEDLEKAIRDAVKRWCLEALPAPIEYVKVRFLKEIPAIVGADMKTYGPFKKGEIAELPKPNAEALIKQEVATYELVPPPPKPPPPPAKARVRFKYPYSAFFVRGVKYGAFVKGDVAEIPMERAKRLVERGYAEWIEGSSKTHSSSSDDRERQPLTLEYKILEHGGFE
jgi:hypothetical protein